jgi:hypothetical protein
MSKAFVLRPKLCTIRELMRWKLPRSWSVRPPRRQQSTNYVFTVFEPLGRIGVLFSTSPMVRSSLRSVIVRPLHGSLRLWPEVSPPLVSLTEMPDHLTWCGPRCQQPEERW